MKLTFRKISMLIVAAICMIFFTNNTVHAAITSTPLETNNTWSLVPLTSPNEVIYYSITLPSDGTLTLTCKNESNYVCWSLSTEDMVAQLYEDLLTSGNATSPGVTSKELVLKQGTYLLAFYTDKAAITGDVSVKAQFESVQSQDMEPNDSPSQAMVLPGKTEVAAMLALTDDEDYYKITIPKSGTITFSFVSNISYYNVELLDTNLMVVKSTEISSHRSDTATLEWYVKSGTYYLKISKTYSSHLGSYRFSYNTDVVTGLQITPANLTLDVHEGADLSVAPVPATATLPDFKWSSSDTDIVRVNDGNIYTYEPGVATITATTTDGSNVSGTCTVIVRPEEAEFRKASQTQKSITLKWYKTEGADGYRVYKYNTSQKKYVAYKDTTKTSMKISKLKTEKKYKYKVIAYINVNGQKVLGKDAGGVSFWTAPKKPKNTKISSIKKYSSNALYNYITVKWKKSKNATGYQVYGKTPGGSWELLASTKKTSTKLFAGKGYTYSIKVRPYRKKHGITTYGKWTKVKKYTSR